MLSTILIVLAVWLLVSAVVGVFIGKFIRYGVGGNQDE